MLLLAESLVVWEKAQVPTPLAQEGAHFLGLSKDYHPDLTAQSLHRAIFSMAKEGTANKKHIKQATYSSSDQMKKNF